MTKLGILLFFAAAMVFFSSSQGAFTGLRDTLNSWRFENATRAPSGDIAIVDIDVKSLDAIGARPWPRSIHARLIDRLTELGAAEVAFDVDFSSRSNSGDDAALETALKRAGGGVILAIFNQSLISGAANASVDANRPIPRFAAHAWGATVNVFADRDGLVRQFPFGQVVDGEPIPSIPAMLGGHFGGMEGLFSIDFGIRAGEIDRMSVIDLLEGRIERSRIENRKIIIGAAATELRNTFAVPAYGIVSGPLLQALAAETILQARVLVATDPIVGGFGLFLLALVTIYVLSRWRTSIALLSLVVLSALIEGAATALQIAFPVAINTSQWHVGIVAFAGLALARELDLRKLLLVVSRRDVRNARTILDQVVMDNFDGVIITGEDQKIRSASRVAAEILLHDKTASLVGKKALDTLPPEMLASIETALAAVKETDRSCASPVKECSFVLRGADDTRVVEYVATPSRLEGGSVRNGARSSRFVVCLTFRDITERRRATEKLAYLARNDTLTGLANRNEYCERLDIAVSGMTSECKGGALICFDLDRFRNINDTLGHETGDLLLQTVAHRVEALLDEDQTLARFGGDEFAVLLPDPTSRVAAGEMADQIIKVVSAPMALGRHRIVVGTSAGIAMIRDPQTDGEQLLRDADTALLKTKSDGGNGRRFFDPEMAADVRTRRELELELWGAFDRKEFEVYYQPQVSLRDHQINGVEALVRWRHPERGFVSPATFVPLAESTGLIEPLGDFILKEACREAASWPGQIKVAVNLSAVQFQRGDLVASVADALRTSGLPAARLDLEITESLFMNDNGQTENILARLRAMGLTFALDDFGTGYSSLSYIHKFPIQKIKIDQAFVTGLPEDQDSLAIIRSVTTLADSLNLTTTVEGVENEAQAKILHLAGCSQGQGYYFGKPQTGAEIHDLLKNQPRTKVSAA